MLNWGLVYNNTSFLHHSMHSLDIAMSDLLFLHILLPFQYIFEWFFFFFQIKVLHFQTRSSALDGLLYQKVVNVKVVSVTLRVVFSSGTLKQALRALTGGSQTICTTSPDFNNTLPLKIKLVH